MEEVTKRQAQIEDSIQAVEDYMKQKEAEILKAVSDKA
jgi:hypothetical protein